MTRGRARLLDTVPGLSIEELTVGEAGTVLAPRSGSPRDTFPHWSPLHEPAYLSMWEQVLGLRNECRIVVAWDATGGLAAYAPLMRVRSPFGPVHVPTLRFIGNNIGYPGDILYSEVFSKTRERTAVQAILDHVASTWSVSKWELGYVAPTSGTWRVASDILRDGMAPPDPQASVPFVSVRLPREWDTYFASLTPNTRSSYRRGLRHLDSLGRLQMTFDETPDAVRRRVGELIENHMRWLAGTDKEGWFGDDSVKRFLVGSSELLAREGQFLSACLELDGTPIAWIVGPAFGRTCFLHLSSYDRRFSEDSPGLVLGLELMRELISRGSRHVRLGPGSNLFKKRLGGVETPYVRILGYQGWTRRVASARGLTWKRPAR